MWHRLLLSLSRQYLRRQTRRRPPRPLSELAPVRVKRVLLISNTALGDTMFSTPAIRALKERYPDWELEVLGHRVFGALLDHNPYVARVWAYPGRNHRLIRLIRELRGRHYDLVIILHGNDPEASMLAHLTGSPFTIGSAGSPLAFSYSARVEPPLDSSVHAIERRLDYVRLLGADTNDKRMDLFLTPEEREEAEAILARHFGALPSLLLALHPTGSDPYKWWPAENFVQFGNFLTKTYDAPLLIISGTKDRENAAAIAARIPGPSLVTGGRYSLRLVAALLSQCRLLVANDSGPLHMGLALKVPTLALIGADHPSRIGPYEVDWGVSLHKREAVCYLSPCLLKKCPEPRCLTAIAASEVIQLIKEWWEPRFWSSEFRDSSFKKKV
ncbi:MAG: glycosyltransferase family 9 protein [Deltaproteobacteria bacterium]|nr:glycosyltransferase family 9 protein [Deltaproteobacteria bacterium]